MSVTNAWPKEGGGVGESGVEERTDMSAVRPSYDWGVLVALVLAVMAIVCMPRAYAPEHPSEHPTEHPTARPAEHPAEHPKPRVKGVLTKEALAEAITHYVTKDAKLKGGYFLVYDAEQKEALVLTLDKVHKERLAHIGGGVYFACADFKAAHGRLYDLDIFMKQTDTGLKVTQILVHKQDGRIRYTWYEEGGIWGRRAADEGSGTR